jgi:hypothetical protein
MVVLILSVLMAVVGLTVVVHLIPSLLSPKSLPITSEWIEELSTGRYRPMLRLLSSEDIEVLRRQRGCTPKMLKKLRVERCRILRAYLWDLDTTFQRTCMALEIIIANSELDRPDLATALLRGQILFTYRKTAIQFGLVLYRYNLVPVHVNALLKLFGGMRLELRTLVRAEVVASV